jgi:mitochondrial fission protein ELM1
MSGTSGNRILILSDGKPGHVNQSIALARLLDSPFETVRVGFRNRPFKLLSCLLDRVGVYLPSLLLWDPPEGTFRAVVSAGSGTYYGNKILARRFNVPSVAIMLPRGYRLDFDLIIAQDHDDPPVRKNILSLPVNLCRVEPTGVFRAREGERYVALVVGGPNPVFGFDRDRFRQALDAVFAGFPDFRIVVTTSRRTPADIEEEIDRYPFEEKILYSRNPVNPIPDFLASCEYVFITADSTSMISEAVTFGRARIEIIPLARRKDSGKYGRMIGNLAELGCVHVFDGRPGTANRKIDLAEALRGITLFG